jgi:hypothetical protein
VTSPEEYLGSLDPDELTKALGSRANAKAWLEGADTNQLINAYRKGGGIRTAQVYGRNVKYTLEGTTTRGAANYQMRQVRALSRAPTAYETRRVVTAPRLMPETIYRIGKNPAHIETLLRDHGWLGMPARAKNVQAIVAARASSRSAADIAKAVYTRAATVEPAITARMRQAAAANGAELAGLEFRLKSEASLTRKIASDAKAAGVSPVIAGAKVSDSVRYTMVVSEAEYSKVTVKVLGELEAEGWQVRVKNYWTYSKTDYKGVNVALIGPDGDRVELQFHTLRSLTVKETQSHPLYERLRVSNDPAERADLVSQLEEVWGSVDTPPDVGLIPSVLAG